MGVEQEMEVEVEEKEKGMVRKTKTRKMCQLQPALEKYNEKGASTYEVMVTEANYLEGNYLAFGSLECMTKEWLHKCQKMMLGAQSHTLYYIWKHKELEVEPYT